MTDRTGRDREILEFIREAILGRGSPPTIREIGEAFGIASTNGVRYHLDLLERRGLIRRRGHVSRGIEILSGPGRKPAAPPVPVPVVGRVAAGAPLLAEQNIEGHLFLDPALLPGKGHFALRVRGDSMTGAGILDGDTVLVRPQREAEPGEIVVALLGDEATVKRLARRRGRYYLDPENEAYEPIPLGDDGREARVLGRVVALIRHYV
jgi:repressor LexA